MSNWWFDCAQSRYDAMMPEDDPWVEIGDEVWLNFDYMTVLDRHGERAIIVDDLEDYPLLVECLLENDLQEIIDAVKEDGSFSL